MLFKCSLKSAWCSLNAAVGLKKPKAAFAHLYSLIQAVLFKGGTGKTPVPQGLK
jgi:hypothetical protein